MKEDYDVLFEWAAWGQLSNKKEYESILLKGHLIIEMALENKLERYDLNKLQKLSFFAKVKAFEKIQFEDKKLHVKLITYLMELNQLRNALAHEFHFDPKESSFKLWVKSILLNLKGEKYSKFTNRTKSVHAFSYLFINILSLE